MAKMRAVDAAVLVLEKEGITPRSACPARRSTRSTPRCARQGSIGHILARHVEGASHMAEGYTRAAAGNIGVCIGTSGPGRHRHDHRPLFGAADSIPILVHHRPGAARAALQGRLPGRRHRVDRQAGHQVGGDGARARAGAARLPAGLPPDALGPAGPGADRPARSTCRWPRSNSTSTPTSRCRSTSRPRRARRSRRRSPCCTTAERPLIVAGGGIINADAERPAGRVRRSSPACR